MSETATSPTTGGRRKAVLRVVCPVPEKGFDPTEVSVPWKILTEYTPNKLTQESEGDSDRVEKIEVVFATPGGTTAQCDQIMIDGKGLYLLKWSMRAGESGRKAYEELVNSGSLSKTLRYADLKVDDYDGLLLPGGHCPDMKPYLEDKTLMKFVSDFSEAGKPIAAVCHGVVLAARAGILKGKRVTALTNWMENVAVGLTFWKPGYYRTYAGTTVEKEVKQHCEEFVGGPFGFDRDSSSNWEKVGFTVQDGQLLTARWPGDTHALGFRFVELLLSL